MLTALQNIVSYEDEMTAEAQFLDEIQTNVLRAFLLAIHSHLTSTSLSWDLYFFKLTQPLPVSTVQLLYTVKEKGGKPDRKPHPLPYGLKSHTETSSLRTLMIMPRNLDEIVRSWIRRLLYISARMYTSGTHLV
jgi:hypothetical protein